MKTSNRTIGNCTVIFLFTIFIKISFLFAVPKDVGGDNNFDRLIKSYPMIAVLLYENDPGTLEEPFLEASKTPRFRFSEIQFLKAERLQPGIEDLLIDKDIRDDDLPIIVLFRDGKIVSDKDNIVMGLVHEATVDEIRDFIDDYFSDRIEAVIKYSKENPSQFSEIPSEQVLFADNSVDYGPAVSYQPIVYNNYTTWSEPYWWGGFFGSSYYSPYWQGYRPLYGPGYGEWPGWYRRNRPGFWDRRIDRWDRGDSRGRRDWRDRDGRRDDRRDGRRDDRRDGRREDRRDDGREDRRTDRRDGRRDDRRTDRREDGRDDRMTDRRNDRRVRDDRQRDRGATDRRAADRGTRDRGGIDRRGSAQDRSRISRPGRDGGRGLGDRGGRQMGASRDRSRGQMGQGARGQMGQSGRSWGGSRDLSGRGGGGDRFGQSSRGMGRSDRSSFGRGDGGRGRGSSISQGGRGSSRQGMGGGRRGGGGRGGRR